MPHLDFRPSTRKSHPLAPNHYCHSLDTAVYSNVPQAFKICLVNLIWLLDKMECGLNQAPTAIPTRKILFPFKLAFNTAQPINQAPDYAIGALPPRQPLPDISAAPCMKPCLKFGYKVSLTGEAAQCKPIL